MMFFLLLDSYLVSLPLGEFDLAAALSPVNSYQIRPCSFKWHGRAAGTHQDSKKQQPNITSYG